MTKGEGGSSGVPEGWQIKPFGEIVDYSQYGLSLPTSSDGIYPMFKMNNFLNGKMSPGNIDKVNLAATELEKYTLAKGDILYRNCQLSSKRTILETGVGDISSGGRTTWTTASS